MIRRDITTLQTEEAMTVPITATALPGRAELA
jgi:hypothetical protein